MAVATTLCTMMHHKSLQLTAGRNLDVLGLRHHGLCSPFAVHAWGLRLSQVQASSRRKRRGLAGFKKPGPQNLMHRG